MNQFEGRFRLAKEPGAGVCCEESGLWVAGVSLLERAPKPGGLDQWRPRPIPDLNRDLGEYYGLPVELQSKIKGLEAVARALDRGDLGHAQIATLHLRIPDPATLTKSVQTADGIIDLARRLHASGLLKAEWDPAKHPRWPAKSPGRVGGEFAPGDGGSVDSAPGEIGASLIPAQFAIPLPYDIPVPGALPLPSEILPPPLVTPNVIPRDAPRNPYPDRAECAAEWAKAEAYCRGLLDRGLLGKGDYRGAGKTFGQCIRGQVSERCGGNSLEA